MSFGTKIKIDDQHVVQHTGTTMTFSGTAKYDDNHVITGATEFTHKGYVDAQVSGATIYDLGSPAAISVGGINAGYELDGKTTNKIIEDLLFPELYPSLNSPSTTSVVLTPTTTTFEVGCVIGTLCVTANFSRGSISPQYCSASPYRSGAANTYHFTGDQVAGSYTCTSTSVTKCATSYTVEAGTNSWSAYISYDAGVQPKTNKNNNYCSALGCGDTTSKSDYFTGIYPWYWGYSDTLPTADSALIASGTKVVATSSGQININFGTLSDKYLWFATPQASTTKTVWKVSELNQGLIGGGDNGLFDSPVVATVDSAQSCWTDENYKVYITCGINSTDGSTFCMLNS